MQGEFAARCAELAMLLEVSATPKPGNIDRDHDYDDTKYEHFLASSVAVYPVLLKATEKRFGLGSLLKSATIESNRWQSGGNTHFGSFLLLLPLLMAAGVSETINDVRTEATRIIKETTYEDAIYLCEAFKSTEVKIKVINVRKKSVMRMVEQIVSIWVIKKKSSQFWENDLLFWKFFVVLIVHERMNEPTPNTKRLNVRRDGESGEDGQITTSKKNTLKHSVA